MVCKVHSEIGPNPSILSLHVTTIAQLKEDRAWDWDYSQTGCIDPYSTEVYVRTYVSLCTKVLYDRHRIPYTYWC